MAAATPSLIIEWYPRKTTVSLSTDDKDKECKFSFDVPDFKKKGKAPASGTFELKSDGKSFSFCVMDGEKPSLKCNVKNLPGDIDVNPSSKLQDGYIHITVKKKTKGSWQERLGKDNWQFPALPDI